ncbi:hypothetical protein [Scale drop disease virus]|nr:hypothetical protein [Scale drop disease virus]QXJ13596.1 ORF009L [Scale drop disease virus]
MLLIFSTYLLKEYPPQFIKRMIIEGYVDQLSKSDIVDCVVTMMKQPNTSVFVFEKLKLLQLYLSPEDYVYLFVRDFNATYEQLVELGVEKHMHVLFAASKNNRKDLLAHFSPETVNEVAIPN